MVLSEDRKIELLLDILNIVDCDIVKDYDNIDNSEDPELIQGNLNEMLSYIDGFESDVLRKD